MAHHDDALNRALEEASLRNHGILGRAGPYGNSLFAFEYDLLPPEAKVTIEHIAAGGPFPYAEDGKIYGNRSADLPGSNVEYREFTVLTPAAQGTSQKLRGDGLPERGARRIVARPNGLLFFTACHYDRVKGHVGSVEHAAKVAALDAQWRNGFYVITGVPPSLREKIRQGLARIRDSRLPAIRPGS